MSIHSNDRKILPNDYQLHDNDVFCGRGSNYFNHLGNVRFREIIAMNVQQYNDSRSKYEKSFMLHEVVKYIRSTSCGAGFVAKDISTGRFYDVGDKCAREKTSQAFRDETNGEYKSSRLSKTKKVCIFHVNDEISLPEESLNTCHFLQIQLPSLSSHRSDQSSNPSDSIASLRSSNNNIDNDSYGIQQSNSLAVVEDRKPTDNCAKLHSFAMNNATHDSNELASSVVANKFISVDEFFDSVNSITSSVGTDETQQGKKNNDSIDCNKKNANGAINACITDEETFDLLFEFTERAAMNDNAVDYHEYQTNRQNYYEEENVSE